MTIEDPILKEIPKEEIIIELNKIRHPIEVAIFNSKNEFNFGAIIRLCNNFLVRKLYGINIEWFYKKAAMTGLKWEKHNIEMCSLQQFLEMTRNRSLISFERRTSIQSKDIRGFNYPQNPIFVFGSEQFGVPDVLLNKSESIVSIRVFGLVHDMNVANAVSIVLYDWIVKHPFGR